MLLSKEQLANLLKAQNALNERYVKDWKNELRLEHFKSALLTEFAEFLESTPRFGINTKKFTGWKWWKTYLEDDVQNSKVEIIDMLHFGLSLHMLAYYRNEDYYIEEQDFDENISLKEDDIYREITISDIDKNNLIKAAYIELFCFLEHGWLSNLMRFLQILGFHHNMSLEEIYKGYFLKNELNLQRIQNGYLEGTYQKVDANGDEDNRKLNV